MRSSALMGILILSLSAAVGAQTQQKKEAAGSITGRITMGGKPAPGISVALLSGEFFARNKKIFKTVTDEEGRFKLNGVAAGRYTVAPIAPGFAGSEDRLGRMGKTVSVGDGENIEGIDFSLAKGGVITGRITDADGRPVIQKEVNLHVIDENGKSQPVNLYAMPYQTRITDDRGVYRIYGLAAGKYLVSAGESPDSRNFSMNQGGGYQRIFYPDAVDEAKAKIVEVSSGSEATNIDITLAGTTKTYEISGRIVNADTGKPIPNIGCAFGIVDAQGNFLGAYGGGGVSDSRGEFRIGGVTPGRYAVFAVPSRENNIYGEPARFEINNSDVGGLELKARIGSSINGVYSLEGTADPEVMAKLLQVEITGRTVDLPKDSSSPFGGSTNKTPDGGFRITGLQPGKVKLALTFRSPKGFVISRVERNGVEMNDGIDIGQGEQVTGVRVVLNYGACTIRGLVKIEGGELPKDAFMSVRVQRPNEAMPSSRFFSEVDARGRFIIQGLAPGDYELVLTAYIRTSDPMKPRQVTSKQAVSATEGNAAEVTMTLNLSEKSEEK